MYLLRAGLIATAILCLSAEEIDPAKIQCSKAGLVVGVELIGDTILFKDPHGDLVRVKADEQTVVTEIQDGQAAAIKIHRSRIEQGDLVCAVLDENAKSAVRVVAVPRATVKKR